MTQKKFSNYLSYAFGEVILVIVGILIALQIGKWAEGVKKSEQEQVLLSNLLTDLKKDKEVLDSLTAHVDRLSQRLVSVAYARNVNDILEYIESARYDFAFQAHNGTFEEAKSIGSMGLIKNNVLRNNTFQYYLALERNRFLNETSAFKYNHEFTTRQIDEKVLASKNYFDKLGIPSRLPELNLEELLSDKELVGSILNRIRILNSQVSGWRAINEQAGELISAIETEQGSEE